MKKLLQIGLMTLTMAFTACHSNETADGVYVWDCSENNCEDSLDFQSFFADAYIIGLEETEDSRVGNINNLAVDDSVMIVMDRLMAKRIFAFNANNGTFLNTIGEVGNSEKEYDWLWGFCLDEEKDLIHVLTTLGKVITYDYKGNWVQTRRVSVQVESIFYNKGKFYFTSTESGVGHLLVTDSNMHITKQHFINTPDYPQVIKLHSIDKNQDGVIIYHRYLDNNIYALDENDDPHVLYHINLGPDSISYREVLGMEHEQVRDKLKEYRGDMSLFNENEDYAFITFWDKSDFIVSVLEKATGKTWTTPFERIKDSKTDSLLLTPIEYYFQNTFIGAVSGEEVNEKLVKNKNVNRGNNPGIYWWKAKK